MSHYYSYGQRRKVDWEVPRSQQGWRSRDQQLADQRDLIVDRIRAGARRYARELSHTDYLSHGEFVMLLKVGEGRFLTAKFPQNSIREQSFIVMLQNPELVHLDRQPSGISHMAGDYDAIEAALKNDEAIFFQPGFPRYGEDAKILREWQELEATPLPPPPKTKRR